ncbi:MAG: SDR family NAD(P)-dependent oxidoreductase, partial [Limnohabitans sp.]
MLNLSGKVALVTGCGSMGPGWGNGKAIAVLLARQGASVFGVDLDLEAARVTEQLIRDEGGTVEVMSADVKQAGEVQRMVQACVERFGRIDVLV